MAWLHIKHFDLSQQEKIQEDLITAQFCDSDPASTIAGLPQVEYSYH